MVMRPDAKLDRRIERFAETQQRVTYARLIITDALRPAINVVDTAVAKVTRARRRAGQRLMTYTIRKISE